MSILIYILLGYLLIGMVIALLTFRELLESVSEVEKEFRKLGKRFNPELITALTLIRIIILWPVVVRAFKS